MIATDSRTALIDVSALSCRRPDDLHQHAFEAIVAVRPDVGPGRGTRSVRKPPSGCGHVRCRHGGARGSEISLCGLGQDQLVQSQVRYRPAQAPVLLMDPLQFLFLKLICAHATVLLLPAVIGLHSHTDLPDRVYPGHALPHQHFNLLQLHNNLCKLWSLGRHLWSSVS